MLPELRTYHKFSVNEALEILEPHVEELLLDSYKVLLINNIFQPYGSKMGQKNGLKDRKARS